MKVLRDFIWLKSFLVVLFVGYYVGGMAFTHTHYFHQHLITHSHPYLPGADGLPRHTHSAVAFETIEALDALVCEVAPVFAVAVMWLLLSVYFQLLRYITFIRPVRISHLRAPPVWCVL